MNDAATIQLAGMPKSGMSADGDAISFTFEARDGRRFAFSCPHEAVTEIIDKLTAMAEAAWQLKGSPDHVEVVKGKRETTQFTTITGMKLSAAAEGIVVSLASGPLVRSVLLSPEKCIELSDALPQALKERKKFFPDH